MCYVGKHFTKNLSQWSGISIFGCEQIDRALGILSSNQINIATFSHQREAHRSPNWWTKVAIFISFELRTPSAPFVGSHPSMLAPLHWLKFFLNGIKNTTCAVV